MANEELLKAFLQRALDGFVTQMDALNAAKTTYSPGALHHGNVLPESGHPVQQLNTIWEAAHPTITTYAAGAAMARKCFEMGLSYFTTLAIALDGHSVFHPPLRLTLVHDRNKLYFRLDLLGSRGRDEAYIPDIHVSVGPVAKMDI